MGNIRILLQLLLTFFLSFSKEPLLHYLAVLQIAKMEKNIILIARFQIAEGKIVFVSGLMLIDGHAMFARRVVEDGGMQ